MNPGGIVWAHTDGGQPGSGRGRLAAPDPAAGSRPAANGQPGQAASRLATPDGWRACGSGVSISRSCSAAGDSHVPASPEDPAPTAQAAVGAGHALPGTRSDAAHRAGGPPPTGAVEDTSACPAGPIFFAGDRIVAKFHDGIYHGKVTAVSPDGFLLVRFDGHFGDYEVDPRGVVLENPAGSL